MKPTILFLFNSSDYAPAPWIADGRFNVVSIDYDDTDHSGTTRATAGNHVHLNIDLSASDAHATVMTALADLEYGPIGFIWSFAPCTSLAVSGAAHFARKRLADPDFQHKAIAMARIVEAFDCPAIVENPVSVLSTEWFKPVYVQPYQFSYLLGYDDEHPQFPDVIPARDIYSKKTGLWCVGGAVAPIGDTAAARPAGDSPLHTKLGGKSARTKYIRSLTPRGLALGVYHTNVAIALRVSGWTP